MVRLWNTPIVEFPLLASLPESLQQRVVAAARRRRFDRREVVVHEGDLADSLHLVRSGRLAAQVATPHGQLATLTVIGPGEYFGEISLLNHRQPRRTATIVALETTETLSISRSTFNRLCEEHPDVLHLLTVALAGTVDRLTQRLLETMYDDLDHRVYRQLVVLAEVYADAPSSNSATIPFTQEVLAEFVGGARPSVNGVLQKLQSRGLVQVHRGKVTVLDRAALTTRLRREGEHR